MKAIDRFNQYLREQQHGEMAVFNNTYGDALLRSEIAKMRAWLLVNDKKYKCWGRFLCNWMNRCDSVIIKAVYNRAAVEKAVENSKKRWNSTSEMERLDEGGKNAE